MMQAATIFIIICTVIFVPNISMADGWEPANTVVINSNLIYTKYKENNLWAVGSGGAILHYSNPVINWHIQASGFHGKLNCLDFIGQSGWAVGDSGVILHTTDTGETWSRQNSFLTGWLGGVDFIDSLNGWVVGSGGILHTTNGGALWSLQNSNSVWGFTDVAFVDQNRGCAVGWMNTIRYTIDGGEHWLPPLDTVSGNMEWMFGLSFVDQFNGWVIGRDGYVRRTTDGGMSWTILGQINRYPLYGICFIDSLHGWAVGDSGAILRTTDSGIHWRNQNLSRLRKRLMSVTFRDENNGWIVGDSSIILHTTTGGQTWVEEQRSTVFPRNLQLSPNYPNPFNSSTTISYSLPQPCNVDLRVFDLQGREISTLEQGYRRAGNYKLNFDGKQLSSGTYFLRLQNGKSQATQKMMLVK